MLFSKKTIQMLEYNDFSVNVDKRFITFKKIYLAKAMLLIPAFFLTLIAVVHIQQHPLKTLAAILIIALITKMIWTGLTKKVHFQIDFSDNTFKFYDNKKNQHWSFLNDVDELSWKSRFVSEYSSAFKSTSEEYEISIQLKMNDNRLFTIFQLQCDYSEPTSEILEVYFFIENILKSIRPI